MFRSILVLLVLAPMGCRPTDTDSDTADTDTDTDTEVPLVELRFAIDDSANGTYDATDGLAWKGSFAYDAVTDQVTYSGAWSGPYPMMTDDGGPDVGGHEPAGATAGDHVWGVSVWFVSPAQAVQFHYGAVSGSVAGSDGEWIWVGANGVLDVAAGQTTPAIAAPLVIPATR